MDQKTTLESFRELLSKIRKSLKFPAYACAVCGAVVPPERRCNRAKSCSTACQHPRSTTEAEKREAASRERARRATWRQKRAAVGLLPSCSRCGFEPVMRTGMDHCPSCNEIAKRSIRRWVETSPEERCLLKELARELALGELAAWQKAHRELKKLKERSCEQS